jgi:YkoY family integral membrane protein
LFSITWTHVIIILELAIIEGLLSFDNALALAAFVKKKLKNPDQRKRALLWGIWGAYILRTATILFGVFLMKYEWVKAAAGIYLVYLAVHELFFVKKIHTKDVENGLNGKALGVVAKASPRVFLRTLIQVELMDFMFSIDGIAVALAISDVAWVLVAGAILGILLMRVAAQYFILLIDKFPILEKTAFVLVGVAGLNIILKLKDLNLGFTRLTIDKPMPENVFFALMVLILAGSFALNRFFYPKKAS